MRYIILLLGLLTLMILLVGCEVFKEQQNNNNPLCHSIDSYVNEEYMGTSVCVDCTPTGCLEFEFYDLNQSKDTTYSAGPGLRNVSIGLNVNSTITNTRGSSGYLNFSKLLYKGLEVSWVYQEEDKVDDFGMMNVVPCIITVDNQRYCERDKP